MRKNIFAYAEIYFRAHGNFFPSARRKISVRRAGNFSSEDAKISFRKKIFFLPQGNKFSCGRNFSSVRTKILRLALTIDLEGEEE